MKDKTTKIETIKLKQPKDEKVETIKLEKKTLKIDNINQAEETKTINKEEQVSPEIKTASQETNEQEKNEYGYLISIECIDKAFSKRIALSLANFFKQNKQDAICAINDTTNEELILKTYYETNNKKEKSNLSVKNDISDEGGLIYNFLLESAAISKNIKQKINPGLDDGKIVITNNFEVGTFVKHAYGYGLDERKIKDVNAIVFNRLKPNITFFLDIYADVITNDAKLREVLEQSYLGYVNHLKRDRTLSIIDAKNKEDTILMDIIAELTKRKVIAI
jgi:thymidylate kinase